MVMKKRWSILFYTNLEKPLRKYLKTAWLIDKNKLFYPTRLPYPLFFLAEIPPSMDRNHARNITTPSRWAEPGRRRDTWWFGFSGSNIIAWIILCGYNAQLAAGLNRINRNGYRTFGTRLKLVIFARLAANCNCLSTLQMVGQFIVIYFLFHRCLWFVEILIFRVQTCGI